MGRSFRGHRPQFTFLIGADGNLEHRFGTAVVKVQGHVAEVLAAASGM